MCVSILLFWNVQLTASHSGAQAIILPLNLVRAPTCSSKRSGDFFRFLRQVHFCTGVHFLLAFHSEPFSAATL